MNQESILEDIDIRPIQDSDIGFVLKTYTQALYKIWPNNLVPRNIFFPKETQKLNFLLQSGAQVLVANVKDSSDDLMGYVIADTRIDNTLIIHWVHTKAIFRKMGIAKELLKALGAESRFLVTTNVNRDFHTVFGPKYNITYNPYLIKG